MAVDRRLPNAEKTLPRRPIAAGTSTSSPGSRSKVPVMEASVSPATKLVVELNPRAISFWVASPRSASTLAVSRLGLSELVSRPIPGRALARSHTIFARSPSPSLEPR